MDEKRGQSMMKTYKAKKPRVKAIQVQYTEEFYEDPWVKKILCMDADGNFYVMAKGGLVIKITAGDIVCKDKERGVVIYDKPSFYEYYEKA